MKLFLHIGTEKTGSSYLQTLLALNRDQLEQNGMFYPDAGNREEDMISGKVSPGNGKALCTALEDKDFDTINKLLNLYHYQADKLECNTILLSNENLIRPLSDEKIFENFYEHCIFNKIEWSEMLLILRDPVSQALSLYKHRAKNGRVAPVENWISSGYDTASCLDNFLSIIKTNKVNITFRKYHKDPIKMQDLIFKDWLKIIAPEVPFIGKVNPSLTISELLMLKNIADHNEKLIRPLYDQLLALPMERKCLEKELSDRYKSIIEKKLIEYSNVWNEYNRYLGNAEQLVLPHENCYDTKTTMNICLSEDQLTILINFLISLKHNTNTLNSVLSKIKGKLKLII